MNSAAQTETIKTELDGMERYQTKHFEGHRVSRLSTGRFYFGFSREGDSAEAAAHIASLLSEDLAWRESVKAPRRLRRVA